MSAAPDPAELAPSRDPAAYGKRPLFTPSFLVWVGLCVVCLAIGAAIGRFGFQVTPVSEPETTPAEAPSHAPAAIPVPTPTATTTAMPAPGGEVGALSDRVARLESNTSHVDEAAATALAAASLSAAAEGAAPFDQDLAAYERLAPDSADLRALAPLAARGAPSRAALAAAFPALASEAAAASHTPAKGAGYLDHLLAFIGRVVIVRNVDPGAGGIDGILARAERSAEAGDLESAVRDLRALPSQARAPLAEWIAAAERRIEIDRHIEAVRADALAALVRPSSPRP
jgi:hypothetical protein